MSPPTVVTPAAPPLRVNARAVPSEFTVPSMVMFCPRTPEAPMPVVSIVVLALSTVLLRSRTVASCVTMPPPSRMPFPPVTSTAPSDVVPPRVLLIVAPPPVPALIVNACIPAVVPFTVPSTRMSAPVAAPPALVESSVVLPVRTITAAPGAVVLRSEIPAPSVTIDPPRKIAPARSATAASGIAPVNCPNVVSVCVASVRIIRLSRNIEALTAMSAPWLVDPITICPVASSARASSEPALIWAVPLAPPTPMDVESVAPSSVSVPSPLPITVLAPPRKSMMLERIVRSFPAISSPPSKRTVFVPALSVTGPAVSMVLLAKEML